MKRFLSLFLALVMSLALAVPAFAAEPDDGDEGIMPLTQIFPDVQITQSQGDYETRDFAATPGNGKTIHVWSQNSMGHPMEIHVYRTDTNREVLTGTAPAYSNWQGDYTSSTADSGIYRVVLIVRGNYGIDCRLAVAQYV